MTDVEELLRQTLTDPRRQVEPVPGLYETVRSRARDRRHRRFAIIAASAAVVALAATGSVVGARVSAQHGATPANIPTPTGPPVHGTVGTSLDLGNKSLTAVDAVATTNAVYVLATNPNTIVLLDPSGTTVKATAAGPTGTPSGLTVDADRLWVWSQDSRDVRVYDSKTLSFIAGFRTTATIFDAVAVDNELYFTSDQGLKVAYTDVEKTGVMTTVARSSVTGSTYGLAADPARHRVLVGVTPIGSAPPNGFVGARVVAVDTRTGAVTMQGAQTDVGKESIAVVGDQVWVGGYGDVDKPRIVHLDAKTLQLIGSSPVNDDIGPGTILWPGQNVLWVRSGGSQTLACIDPKTGSILEYWDNVQGPITSVGGSAFGVQYGLQQLILGGSCTG